MKSQTKNSLIIIILLVVVAVLYIIKSGLPFAIVNPSTGAFPIVGNPFTYNYPNVNATTFKCEADECIVSGTIKVSKNIGGTGYYSCFGQGPPATQFQTLSLCQSGRASDSLNGKIRLNDRGTQCTSQSCALVEVQNYTASFNFCPSSDVNFAFCKGSSSLVHSTSIQSFTTDEKKITRNQIIEFLPKNGDNTAITDKSLTIRVYDLSCTTNLISPTNPSGTVCLPGQIKCSPKVGTQTKLSENCLVDGATFNNLRCPNGQPPTRRNGVECSTYTSKPWCDGATNYGYYFGCTSTQKIGASNCGAFDVTKLLPAPSNQECFLLNANNQISNSQGTGLGALACSSQSNPCVVGTKVKVSDYSYKECKMINGCPSYTTDITCPSQGTIQSIFDITSNSCILPTATACGNPQQAQCQSKGSRQIRSCQFVSFGGLSGYQWDTAYSTCPGELICDTKDNTHADDFCSTTLGDTCQLGDTKCIDNINYQKCARNPLEVNSYLKMRNLGDKIEDLKYECDVSTNQIVLRGDLGCGFNTPGYQCSSTKDSNGLILELCTNNICTATADKQATESNYNNLNTKCLSNSIYKAERYVTTDRGTEIGQITYYRWVPKIDAPNTLNGVCKSDFVCKETSGQASCVPATGFMAITSKSEYAIGEKLSNIKVTLGSDYPGVKSNIPLTIRLYEGTELKEIVSPKPLTSVTGEATFSFEYTTQRTGSLTIEVIAGDPTTSPFKNTKSINVKKTLEVVLTCPAQGYIDRQIECTFKIRDAEDISKLISGANVQVSVSGAEYSSTTSSITFKPSSFGSVTVTVTASTEGYITDTATTAIDVLDPVNSRVLTVKLDTQDIQSYSVVGVQVGAHQIQMSLDEAGVSPEIFSIQAKLRSPTSQETDISFNNNGGSWVGTINTPDAGQTYRIKGSILFVDKNREPYDFEYNFPTTASNTDDLGTQYWRIIAIIGASIAVLIFAIVVVILARRKR